VLKNNTLKNVTYARSISKRIIYVRAASFICSSRVDSV